MNEVASRGSLVRVFAVAAVLTLTMMCAFAACGSAVAWVLVGMQADAMGLDRTALVMRAIVFGVAAAGAAWGLVRLRPDRLPEPDPAVQRPPSPYATLALLVVLAAAAFLTIFGLDRYPHAEPDELHHLIVARNLAESGAYASGHPDSGLVYFDPYDSVGPSVILPVSAVFALVGPSLAAARMIMAAFFLGLCLAAYKLMRPAYGSWAAVGSVTLIVCALGSLYLARTLYGEVAAFTYILAGGLAWRKAVSLDKRALPWAIASGLLFGLALLAKFFLVVLVFPVGAAILFDWLTWRRIAWRKAAIVAVGTALPVAIWLVAQKALTPPGNSAAAGMGALYIHYLLFGLAGVPAGFDLLYNWLNPVAMALLALAGATPLVFYRRYDPFLAALWLTAVFVLTWWIFFTPGQIIRYTWYTHVIAALFAAPVIGVLIGNQANRHAHPVGRGIAWVALAGFTGAMWQTTAGPARGVVSADDMAGDRELVAYIGQIPEDHSVGATFFTVPRIANFFGDRPVQLLYDDPRSLAACDVVIAAPHQAQRYKRIRPVDEVAGPYGVYLNDQK